MTTMLSEIYDALIAAGSPEDKARKAAEAVAGYENRFSKIEGKLDAEFAAVRGELTLLKWMMGFVLGGIVIVLMRSFFPS
ncbi:MAG: hypothetical protein NW203_03030 [Hyphomonadaceae bacterium]|nr:hypothetical protein [Hyphomonadaceae bacterium]